MESERRQFDWTRVSRNDCERAFVVREGTDELIGEQENSLEGELSVTEVEQVLQTRTE